MKKSLLLIIALMFYGCATHQQTIPITPTFQENKQIILDNSLDSQLANLTNQIVESLSQESKSKIAVIEFSDLNGNITEFGMYLSEELITRLFLTRKFDVIERQLLNQIISEQKLGMTGLIDDESAIAIGKILGVDAIVSGTITDFGTDLKVNARIISTETGKVFGVAGTKIVKDETVEKLMGIISTVQKEEIQKQTEKKEISKEVLKKIEAEKFTFELTKCEMSSGGKVTCDLLITNNAKDRELTLFTNTTSRMFDYFGNEYRPNQWELANKKGGLTGGIFDSICTFRIQSLLISGISTKASLTFKNVTQKANGISLLEVSFWEQESGNFKIKFRNIPLSK